MRRELAHRSLTFPILLGIVMISLTVGASSVRRGSVGVGIQRPNPLRLLPLPSAQETRKAQKLAYRVYDEWLAGRLEGVYDLLSPEAYVRSNFRGDRQKILRAMTAWREHALKTLHPPKKTSLKLLKKITYRQAIVLAGIMLGPKSLEAVKSNDSYLERKVVFFEHRLAGKRYLVGCYWSGGKWGALNAPFTMEAPRSLLVD